MTISHDGTILYTPFPDYEVEDPPGAGANTIHTTYRLAGQIVAVKSRTTGNGTLYDAYTDHLGNVVGLGQTNTWLANSQARYDPFGNFRTTPDPAINPDVTNVGFTGHRHNNTGSFPVENVGLIYMNARYYLPEIGQFISPDTIVPEPGNPQSFNRYSYTLNNPVNYTDPSGNCPVCVVIGLVALKVVDYGWTAWDTYQSGRVLANPDSTSEDRLFAALNVALAISIELVEPDDFLPTGLPLDDLTRREIMSGARQAVQEGGLGAGVRFLTNSLGDQAPSVIRHLYDQGIFREIRSAGEWKSILAGVRGQAGLEVYHIIEQRFAGRLGVAADDLPGIVLDRTFHQQEVTARLFHELPPGRGHSFQTIWDAYVRVYGSGPGGLNHPDWLEVIWPYFKQLGVTQ